MGHGAFLGRLHDLASALGGRPALRFCMLRGFRFAIRTDAAEFGNGGSAMEFLLLAVLLGLIPAVIARSKGRSFVLWWIWIERLTMLRFSQRAALAA